MRPNIGCVVIAGALLALGPQAGFAQLGRLTKKVQEATTRRDEPKPAASGASRVTATIEWTLESVMKDHGGCRHREGIAELCMVGSIEFPPTAKAHQNGAATPGTLTDREEGRVMLELEVDANSLPGGMVSRMSAGAGLYSIGSTAGQPMNADRVVAITGGTTLTRQVRPFDRCHRLDASAGTDAGKWIDPVTLDATGREEFRASEVNIVIGFQGEKPVSVDFMHQPAFARGFSVRTSGRGTYACGGGFTVRDSSSQLGLVVKINDQFAGMKTQLVKTATGYVLTGRQEEVQEAMPDLARQPEPTRVIRTVKLTWAAPPAPAQTQPAGDGAPNMADRMKFESGKGSITVTQQGKRATWPLQSVSETNQAGVNSTTMMFTPDGGLPSEERGVIALAVTDVMGQTMVGLNVAKGPAGDAEFEANECTAQIKPAAAGTFSGSGECRKPGVVVTFTFTSAKSR